MNNRYSFILGFNYGKHNNVELTANQIAHQFPDVDSDAFTQGCVDGVNNDRFRLDLTTLWCSLQR